MNAVYLDCNATAPIADEVLDLVTRIMREELGNAGSRTHAYGARANRRVEQAREQVRLTLVPTQAAPGDEDAVVFTSGATEANNLALLGLAEHGRTQGRRHFVTTSIEHKAVLEPLHHLATHGFELTEVAPRATGIVVAEDVLGAVRDDTLAVSVMHVNNETGAIQPISDIAGGLAGHPAYLHVDAAQSFGKLNETLCDSRIDLVSISGHKCFGPPGVGALVLRRRDYALPPLTPLVFGGGQESGLRPGTLPVALVAGLGLAAELAQKHLASRSARIQELHEAFEEWRVTVGAQRVVPNDLSIASTLCLTVPEVNAEALMVAVRDVAAMSNGSACTAASRSPSHVLAAMGLSPEAIASTVRLSWSHETPAPDWQRLKAAVEALR